jgi:hypothetical protein
MSGLAGLAAGASPAKVGRHPACTPEPSRDRDGAAPRLKTAHIPSDGIDVVDAIEISSGEPAMRGMARRLIAD